MFKDFRKDIIIFIITIIIIIAISLMIGFIVKEKFTPRYFNGKIIEVNEQDNNIKVDVENGGRVYVNNIGDFTYQDFTYGDIVKLELVDRKFKIVSIN